MILLQCFSKYLSNINKILAFPKLNIDKLKNVLKFINILRFLVGKALPGVNWKNLIYIFTFLALISFNAVELQLNV